MVLLFNFVLIHDYCTHLAWMNFLMLQICFPFPLYCSCVCSRQPCTLRWSNHTNSEHFLRRFCFQVFRQAGPPQLVDCLTPMGNQRKVYFQQGHKLPPINGRVDRASATEAVNSDSIPGRVNPKTIKIGIHSFSA